MEEEGEREKRRETGRKREKKRERETEEERGVFRELLKPSAEVVTCSGQEDYSVC